MRYRVLLAVEVDAPSDAHARDWALQLEALIKEPIVQMTLEGKGIRLAGDGQPTAFQPQRLP